MPKAGGVCTFTNTFTPAGSITLRKSTIGGTGTFQFAVRPQFGEVKELLQRATTTSESASDSVRATGDATGHLPLGVYTIQETTASAEGDNGLWRVDSVICDGTPQQSFEGGIRIELTRAQSGSRLHLDERAGQVAAPARAAQPGAADPADTDTDTAADAGARAARVAAAVARRSRRYRRGQSPRRAAGHEGREPSPHHAGQDRALEGHGPQPRADHRARRDAGRARHGRPRVAEAAHEQGPLPQRARRASA